MLLGFLPGSKRTAPHFLSAFAQLFSLAVAPLLDVLLRLRLNQPELDLPVSVAVSQPWS